MRSSLCFVYSIFFWPWVIAKHGPAVPSTTTTASAYNWSISDDGGGASDIEPSGSSSDDEHWENPKKDKNKPMKTLEKLQQMLDETDYMMKRQPLWTSSDRAKYKRQQRRYGDESDEERMGYTLPDLPIYNSDAEEDDTVDDKLQKFPNPPTSTYPGQRIVSQPLPPRYTNNVNQEYDPHLPVDNYPNGYVPPPPEQNGSHQYPSQTNGRLFDNTSQRYYTQIPNRPPPIQQSFQPLRPDQSSIRPQSPPPNHIHPQQISMSRSGPYRQQEAANQGVHRQQSPQDKEFYQQQATGHAFSSPNRPVGEEFQHAPERQGYRDAQTYDYSQTQQPSQHQYPEKLSFNVEQNQQEVVRPPSYSDVRQQFNDQYWLQRFRQQEENTGLPFNDNKSSIMKGQVQAKYNALHRELRHPLAMDPLFGLGQPLRATPPMNMDKAHVYKSTGPNPREEVFSTESASLVEAGTRLSLVSLFKLGYVSVIAALMAYAAVSPRDLPLTEYNLQFYENLRLISLLLVAPAIYIVAVFDAKESDFNSFTHTFFCTFSLGYLLSFAVEIMTTTGLRLALFGIFEREVFTLTPKVALPILPWVLKDQNYRPKRITLFAVDFLTSCVLCPIVEEYIKLALLVGTSRLPTNFRWKRKASSRRSPAKMVAEPIVRLKGEKDELSANRYVTQMLAVSLALKLCDAGRRVLLYTKESNANKGFYSLLRGVFPIHELCGTMTALALAKRDLLGFHIPLWKLLAPAIVVHGMANFRGKKPLFKWNSSTPWSEMQLSPLHKPDASTLPELLKKGYAKLMWLIVLSRVLGYCIKNYYLVNRQAVKRTTKYAQNPAAFSAELATAELLKNQKQ